MIGFRFAMDRCAGAAVVLALLLFAGYGLFSTPNLAAGWAVSFAVVPAMLIWASIALGPFALSSRMSSRRLFYGAVAMALLLRIGIAVIVAGRVHPGDSAIYLELARHLIEGKGFFVLDPFMGVLTRGLFPPFYPVLLAGWGMIAGLSTASLLALNGLVDLVAAMLIVRLGTAIGDRRSGLAAAWLFLIWPSVLLSAPIAQKEGLCVVFALALANIWVDARRCGSGFVRVGFGIGIAAGLLALTQPGEAPLAAMFGIVLVERRSVFRALAVGMVALPFGMAVMAPWWIRNWIVFGTFVPLTTASGYSLWVGNNPDANGHWMPPPVRLRGLPEIAFGKAAAAIAVDWMSANPVAFVRTTIAKTLRGWGISEFGVARLHWMAPQVAAVTTAIAFAVSQTAHLALLGANAMAAWMSRGGRGGAPATAFLLVLACIAQTLIFGIWFEFGERHRDFATPFLLLFAITAWREYSVPVVRR